MKTSTTTQIVIRISAIIAVVELIIMIVFQSIHFVPGKYTEVILDSFLLVLFSTPIIYLWIINPYRASHEARLADILDHTDDAYLTLDKNWIITYANPVSESLLNIKPNEIVGSDLRETQADLVSMFYKILYRTFSSQSSQVTTVLFGPTMNHLEVHACPTAEGLIISFRDITSRINSESKLRIANENELVNKEKIKAVDELAGYMKAIDQYALVSVTDPTGKIIEANDIFCKVTGYKREELIGQNHNIINSGTHSKSFFAELWKTISSGHKWHGEVCNRAKDGSIYWVKSAIVPVKNTDGEIERYISVRIDITNQKQQAEEMKFAYKQLEEANNQLEQICRIDALTNIANRRQFDETLSNEISKLSRIKIPLTLFICDLDYFKNFNDTYGHPAGDACLQQIAMTLNSSFTRADDLVARYGGEEFAIILPNVDRDTALLLAERMRANIEKLNLEHRSSMLTAKSVTISIGVTSLIPDKNSRASMIIDNADKALYKAKDKGRNNVQYFSETGI